MAKERYKFAVVEWENEQEVRVFSAGWWLNYDERSTPDDITLAATLEMTNDHEYVATTVQEIPKRQMIDYDIIQGVKVK